MRLAPPANCFDSVLRAELLEDLTLELVDPPKSYAHAIRDLLVGEPQSQILHEFVLPIRQRLAAQTTRSPTFAIRLLFRDLLLRAWNAKGQRGQEMGRRKRFRQESVGAAFPRQVDRPRIIKAGDHHDDEVREQRLEASGAFDAGHAGHFDVHQYNLRAGVGNSDEGSFAAGIRTDAPELARVIDDVPEENLEVLVVIHNRHTDLTERQGGWL